MIAYIPARGGSKRIVKKNIKHLGGKPSIGHVIDNISQLDFIDDICVSTDDREIKRVAEHYGAKTLRLRSPELCGDNIGFMQLIREDVPRFIDKGKEVLFVLATACLVPPHIFREAFQSYMENKPDMLMSTTVYNISPFKALVPKTDGHWQYLFPKESSFMTQSLPRTMVDAGAFYFFNQDRINKLKYCKSIKRLAVYQVNSIYVQDVDTLEDWKILKEKYRTLHRNKEITA